VASPARLGEKGARQLSEAAGRREERTAVDGPRLSPT
jgi:hypothetical protein